MKNSRKFNIGQKISLSSHFLKKPRSLLGIAKGYLIRGIGNKPYLRSLELNITSDCNLSCEMCYASKYKRPHESLMSVSEYKSLWHQAKKLGAFGVHLIGGEPTIRKDLFDILAVLEPRKYLVSIVTNAFAVEEEMIKEFGKLKLFTICVSLDSDNESENDKIRGEGSFMKALSVIDLCKKYNIMPEVSFTVSKSSMSRFNRMLEFTRSKGILLGCSSLSPTGRFEGMFDECPQEDEWLILKENLPSLRFDFSHTFKGVGCPGGVEKLCISPYGDVQTCAINPISFGNVRDKPLEDIWRFIHSQFSYFHKDRKYPRCVVTWDKDYHKKILEPSYSSNINPVKLVDLPTYEEKV